MSSLLSCPHLLLICRGRCQSEPEVSVVRCLHRLLLLLLLLHGESSISMKTYKAQSDVYDHG